MVVVAICAVVAVAVAAAVVQNRRRHALGQLVAVAVVVSS